MKFLNYTSIQQLKKTTLQLSEKKKISPALRLIHDLVERIITEPLCTAQVFGSKTLDELCQYLGRKNLTHVLKDSYKPHKGQADTPVFVYLITKLQKSGGHSRVIENFIQARPEAHHILLSTELCGKSDATYLSTLLDTHSNIFFEKPSPRTSYQEKLTWLQKRLLELRPQKTYLFNHHQDSIIIAAVQPEMKLDFSFYHHGDHHLCLGVYLKNIEHIDPHPMGYHHCRDILGIENIYIPLTAEDKGKRPDTWTFNCKNITTCTAARSNKVEIPYFVSYMDMIPKIIAATKGRHIHIGQLTPWALFRIRKGMKQQGIPAHRFVYIPWVPSVWEALHTHRVDLYIASFPYGGGLTLIEAMGAGIPVALHKHIFSPVLSGLELAYSHAFSWRYPEELLDYCTSLNTEKLEHLSLSSRLQYEKFHSDQKLPKILKSSMEDSPKPEKSTENFSIEKDEWALWMEQQVNITRLSSRALYRVLKRFRNYW